MTAQGSASEPGGIDEPYGIIEFIAATAAEFQIDAAFTVEMPPEFTGPAAEPDLSEGSGPEYVAQFLPAVMVALADEQRSVVAEGRPGPGFDAEIGQLPIGLGLFIPLVLE